MELFNPFRLNYKNLLGILKQIGASLVAQMVESACSAGDLGSILGLGRSPGEGNGNPVQYSCFENYMDGGAWQATVHGGHKESDPTEQLRARQTNNASSSLLDTSKESKQSELLLADIWGHYQSPLSEKTR